MELTLSGSCDVALAKAYGFCKLQASSGMLLLVFVQERCFP